MAWLYPLITDGLALVAYASTAQLTEHGRTYAWTVVVLAAGVSGLAQAVYLAGGVESAPAELRFGVGAWPAVAAAIVAHLLFLLGAVRKRAADPVSDGATGAVVQPAGSAVPSPVSPAGDRRPYAAVQQTPVAVEPSRVQPSNERGSAAAVQPPRLPRGVQHERVQRPAGQPASASSAQESTPASPSTRVLPSPARDRAVDVARRHIARHGGLPTVTQLAERAEVARGTAGNVLKELREQPTPLHLVTSTEAHANANDQHDEITKAQP